MQRLVATAREAQFIASLVPAQSRLVATGFGATRQSVFDSDLDQFRYVHFATHGFVDSRYPALSALALSQFNERGETLDGYFRLRDIHDLKLNADVVVLSACETALGREIRGEGLVGLSHGFLSSGAKSVVVSLWNVEDRATAELMTQFYSNLLGNKLSPSEALRRAQQTLISDARWSDPYFWGAFTLAGDWR
jgi:CHAT domain-containing protein